MQVIPCGVQVILFYFEDQWTCAVTNPTDACVWLSFVKKHLLQYGVDFSDLNPTSNYTFICTNNELTPSKQDALYFINEYNPDRNVHTDLMLPRPYQIVMSTDKLLAKFSDR